MPQIESDEVSPAAERGSMIHAFLERVRELGLEAAIEFATRPLPADERAKVSWLLRAINLESLPTHLATEVAFLYDWKARSAREIGRNIGRDYVGHLRRTLQAPIGSTEIPITIDLVGAELVEGRGRVGYVGDYKSGWSKYPAPDRFGQTLLAAVCVRHVYQCESVVLELLYVRTNGDNGIARRTCDEWDLDTFADELEAAMDLVEYSDEEYTAGRGVPVREGAHCEHCPAFKQCPAKVALVKSIPAELVSMGVTAAVLHGEDAVPGTVVAGGAMSKERAAEVWMVIERIEDVFSRIREEICLMGATEAIELPDGRVIGPLHTERENLVGRVAAGVLESMFGGDAVKHGVDLSEAIDIKVSKSSAAGVIGKIVKARAEALGGKPEVMQSKASTGVVDRFLSEVRRRNGIEVSTSSSVKPHVPRKRLKP